MREVLCFLCSIVFLGKAASGVTVCDEYEYYYHPNAEHCFDDLDSERNISEIIRNWGITSEDYLIYTDDGYQINVVRAYSQITQEVPVLLGHGITANGYSYVLRQNKSFVHFLCSKGFDVWVMNYRGTRFSRGHRYLNVTDSAYWNFSFQEIGQYDLLATLQLIAQMTGKKILYIGFSLGTTVSYSFASTYPSLAEQYLEGIISMAPVAYLKDIRSGLRLLQPFTPVIRRLGYAVFHGELLQDNPLVFELCGHYPVQFILCQKLRNFLFGHNLKEYDPAYQPLTFKILMDSVGVDVLTHFAQLIKSRKFLARDLGWEGNMKRYGQPSPPPFDLSRIPVPVSLLYADNDFIATEKNANQLYSELDPRMRCGIDKVKLKGFNHAHFMEARHIRPLVLEPLYEKIERVLKKKCNEITKHFY